jgi:hypothetical protein
MKKLIFRSFLFHVFSRFCPRKKRTLTRYDPTGSWEFRQADTIGDWMPATVPGVAHTDLLKIAKIPDQFYRTNEKDFQWIGEKPWTYRKTFTDDANILSNQVVSIVFECKHCFSCTNP